MLLNRSPYLALILALCALMVGLTACGQPAALTPAPVRTATPDIPAAPTATLVAPSATLPALPSATPTLAPTATLPAPTATQPAPTATQPAPTTPPLGIAFKGLLVYHRAQETMTGYDFTGAALKQQYKVPGAGWIGEMTSQWIDGTLFYLKANEKAIYQVTTAGAAIKLAFIPAKDNLRFVISANGKKIVWSFTQPTTPNPSSELWTANLDGSAAKKIAQLDATTNTKMLSLKPYRWLADGRLVYVSEPTGIGGYILFSGFSGIHIFDFNANRATDLTPAMGAGGLCLEEISADLSTLLSTCTAGDHSTLAYINLATQKSLAITRQADQNQVGSPLFSSSGNWLAYAYARGDGDDEVGHVAVVQNGSTTPKILGSVTKGTFSVKAWFNETQFIVQRYDGETASVWLFSRDSGRPVKLADGEFIALMR
jgi:hypothetical protein